MRIRQILSTTLSVSLLAATAVAVAPAATAAPVFHPGRAVIVGDLTADGILDRITLGSFQRGSTVACGYQVQAGLGGGKFAAPYVGNLPIASTDGTGPNICPNLGVVVKGPSAAQNQLAVTNDFIQMSEPSLQFFHGFATHAVRYNGGFDGQFQPSSLNSVDFDGDGWGDIWETTDQGSAFEAWVGRPATGWHQLYASPFSNLARPQFFDFNRAGGIDALVTWTNFGAGAGVSVVDGRTGAVQVLEQSDLDEDTLYQASVIDFNHDGYPDIAVQIDPNDGSGLPTQQIFLNKSQGGRWLFQAL